MIVETLYTYLGTNGTVTTPVQLEGVPAMKTAHLIPEEGEKLSNGERTVTSEIMVSEKEAEKWYVVK